MDSVIGIVIAFIAAIFISNFATRLKYLPKITIYIIIGIVVGPSIFNFITNETVKNLYIIKKIALGLLLFIVGEEFTFSKIKKIEKKVLSVSFFEILLTFLLVGGGIFILTKSYSKALFAGIIATATAPASTLMILREQSSEGKLTTFIKGMTGINNMFALIIFILSYPFIYYLDFGSLPGGTLHNFWLSFLTVFESILVGVVIGILMALWEVKEHKDANKVFVGFTAVILAIAVSKSLNLNEMIVFIVMGVAHANSSVSQTELKDLVKKVDLPFYVLFFILSGAYLKISEVISAGLLGVTYIILRALGKYLGVRIGCKRKKLPVNLGKLLSLSLFSHSAIAIGLTGFIAMKTQNRLNDLVTAVLASIVVFEIIGPILAKIMVLKSGESTIANVMKSRSRQPYSTMRSVFKEILRSIGIIKNKEKSISDSLIKNISALHETANYTKVLKFIEHSSYDSFPVVNEEGYFVGAISYFDIQDIAFDPFLTNIITATDLLKKDLFINIDDPIEKVIKKFKSTNNAFLPAIHFEEEKAHFVGFLSQRDVLSSTINNN